jgi:hypothetical protein
MLNKIEGAEILDWYMKGIDIYNNADGGLKEVGERIGRSARKIMEE